MRAVNNFENDILAGFNASQASLQQALEEVSTGQRVNNPSDDPAAAAAMVTNQAETDQVDQYTSNVDTALGIAQSSDSILSSVTGLLTQAVSLGTEGANGTSNANNRSAIATEVSGILQSIVSEANSTYEGAGLFTGTAGAGPAFVADATSPSGYSYQGNESTNQVQVGDTFTLPVNVPGDQVFGSALTALSQLVSALQSGDVAAIGTATGTVSSALNGVTQFHANYGDAINQLHTQESFLSTEKLTLSQEQSNLVDVDSATAAEQLAQAEAQSSAVLAAAAKVQPTNLLSYLQG
jgi:flagellar hook-associated protein 3 FlgL